MQSLFFLFKYKSYRKKTFTLGTQQVYLKGGKAEVEY